MNPDYNTRIRDIIGNALNDMYQAGIECAIGNRAPKRVIGCVDKVTSDLSQLLLDFVNDCTGMSERVPPLDTEWGKTIPHKPILKPIVTTPKKHGRYGTLAEGRSKKK